MVMIAGDQFDRLHSAAMWRINFDHFTRPVGFTTCSELQATAQTYRHSQGGDLIGEEFIGGFEFNDLTIEGGMYQDEQLANWWDSICKVVQQVGALPSTYKHNGELVLLNMDGTDGPKWDIIRGFIKEYKAAGGMDSNNKTAPIMQSAVIGMRHWKYRGLA